MQTASPMNSLASEQALISALVDVLEQEQQHLVAADIDSLSEVTPRKTALVNEMGLLAAQRHRLLKAAGYDAEEAGMEAWLAACGSAEDSAQWEAILAQTREAKELNRLNGMLINRQLGNTQGALQALRPTTAPVYGPSGHTTGPGPRRGFIAG